LMTGFETALVIARNNQLGCRRPLEPEVTLQRALIRPRIRLPR
jgi:hypothetical protein